MTETNASVAAVPRAKLPVIPTVGRAYKATLSNLWTLIRIAWFWVLVMAALQWVLVSVLPTWLSNPLEMMRLDTAGWIWAGFLGFLQSLIILPILASVAVNWHRFLLLGERPAPTAFLRLDGLVWSYAALGAVLAFLRFLANLPQFATARMAGITPEMAAMRGAAGIIFVVALFYLTRLSLALPGRALGDQNFGFSAAYRATRGSTWRMSWGSFFCFLPVLILGAGAFLVWPGYEVMMSNDPLAIAIRVGQSALWPLLGIVFVSFLSFTYEHFFPERVAHLRAGAAV